MPAKFRLACGAMVANESDIIESFARHTLAFVDHLHIQFHNSYDSSQQIVEGLIAEGLPVSFEIAASPVFQRGHLGDALMREVAARDRYDYLLPLDADEFIVAASRAELEAELAAAPPGGALSLAWLSYVPTECDDPVDPNPVTRIRHRLPSPHPCMRKVFFAAGLLAHDDVCLADGNHRLLSSRGREIVERESSRIFLAHYPIRTAQQLASKAVIGTIARRLSADFNENQSRHWRSLVDDLAVTPDLPARELSRYAVEYLGSTEADLIDAPLATEARMLRYCDMIRVDAFARLSAFVAALVSADALRGAPDDASPRSDGRDGHQVLLKEVDEARQTVQQLYKRKRKAERRVRLLLAFGILSSLALLVLHPLSR